MMKRGDARCLVRTLRRLSDMAMLEEGGSAKGAAARESSAQPPILSGKRYAEPSAFRPEALLREARRQRKRPLLSVPDICVLDPDGDLVRRLRREGGARLHEG